MLARKFEDTVMPHLDAAFNYARWLTKSDVLNTRTWKQLEKLLRKRH